MFFFHFFLFLLINGLFISGVPDVSAASEKMYIMLYPDNADVEEVRELHLEQGEAVFVLPKSAEASSLYIHAIDREILDMQFREVDAVAPPRLTVLRQELEALQKDIEGLQSRLFTVDAQKTFWLKPPLQSRTAAELLEVEQLAQTRFQELEVESLAVQTALKAKQKAYAQLEKRLQRLNAGGNGIDETTTEVRLRFDGEQSGRVNCVLSYRLESCGWTAQTLLNAQPKNNQVTITQLATIRQQTGIDWNNAVLQLSTAQPSAAIKPAYMPKWRIDTDDSRMPQERNMMLMMDSPPLAKAESASNQVDFVSGATYGFWELGQREVLTGDSLVVTLSTLDLGAEFVRLIRPQVSESAYLMATLESEKPLTMPERPATFLVDNARVGYGNFSFMGTKDTLFFGTDPGVKATMLLNDRKSGSEGILSKEDSLAWDWTITIKNTHAEAIKVQVEDSAPQLGDERIQLTMDSTPVPNIVEKKVIWSLDVPAGDESRIQYAVKTTTPAKLNVRSSR